MNYVDRAVACAKGTNARLLLMQGVPGSGKSTVARALQDKNKSLVVVCADDEFVTSEGYKFDATRLREVHEMTQAKARKALAHGSIVLVDNCNTKSMHAIPYLNMLKKGESAVVLYLHAGSRMDALRFGARSEHKPPDHTVVNAYEGMERIESSLVKVHYITHNS